MPRLWKPLLICGLMGVMVATSGWGEQPRSAPQQETEDDAILQNLEIVRELEMLHMLELIREMEMLGEMEQLLPSESESGEEGR